VAFDSKETLLLVTERKNNEASNECTPATPAATSLISVLFRGIEAGLAINREYPVWILHANVSQVSLG
jgi:hypothetical protein